MNINLTLIVQMVVFIALIWFTMKFVWPMIIGADGRALAQDRRRTCCRREGQADLHQADERAEAIMREARERAAQIVDQASRANEMVEEAKSTASRPKAPAAAGTAKEQIDLESRAAREGLRREVAQIAVRARRDSSARDRCAQTHARHASTSSRRRPRTLCMAEQDHHRPALRQSGVRVGPGGRRSAAAGRRGCALAATVVARSAGARAAQATRSVTAARICAQFVDGRHRRARSSGHGQNFLRMLARETPPAAICRRSPRCSTNSCAPRPRTTIDVDGDLGRADRRRADRGARAGAESASSSARCDMHYRHGRRTDRRRRDSRRRSR